MEQGEAPRLEAVPQNPPLASRIRHIPPTVFAEMSALAVRTGALNLGQGFPDSDGPPAVLDRAAAALRHGENQYAPGIGRFELRQAIAQHQFDRYQIVLDPDREVVVTTGCTEAIAAAVLSLVEPGDEVIVLDPMYDSYPAVLAMAGAVPRPVTLRFPDFRLDPEELAAALSPRTRFVLLNTPHNPTGRVLDRTELQAVADLAIAHDLVVITDEVYEHLTYDDVLHVPISTLPGMAGRTLTLSSVGKSWSLTGWKVGWATGPAHLVDAVTAVKQWLTFTSGAPLQSAVALALTHEREWPAVAARSLSARRDLLLAGLHQAGLVTNRPQGTYFAVTDISALGWFDSEAFVRALPERAGVVAIPMQGFHADPATGRHLVRWAFCKNTEVLSEACRRLSDADLRGPMHRG